MHKLEDCQAHITHAFLPVVVQSGSDGYNDQGANWKMFLNVSIEWNLCVPGSEEADNWSSLDSSVITFKLDKYDRTRLDNWPFKDKYPFVYEL